MRFAEKTNIRHNVLSLILAAVMVIYLGRFVFIQLINPDYYIEQANGVSTYVSVIKAPRGEILDCYGRPIAINRDGYNIVFNRAYMSASDMNKTILDITSYLEDKKIEWTDSLPITKTEPYTFEEGKEAAIKKLKSRLALNDYATFENCISNLISKYGVESLSADLQRTVIGVRYSMELADFSVAYPFTLAEDIGNEAMVDILESGYALKGVEVQTVPIREYVDSDIAPHIIGTVGPIYDEDWEKYKEKGYLYSDKVGNGGIEEQSEDYLRGIDGELTYKIDNTGKIVSSEVTKKPIAGNTVILTLDKNIQRASQDALADVIQNLRLTDSSISGGAVVVSNVNTGDILASANYPSYDLNTFINDYDSMPTENDPMFNRAFCGPYPPGSAFKPAVASIALQLGKITADENICCLKTYHYSDDLNPNCMHRHGNVNVIEALSVSCNYYFFETGRRLGIDSMNQYCLQLGLGLKTGIQLEESAGILAGREYSQNVGKIWYEGNVLSAAIGQSDNSFTPLQLAIYSATIANGGTRYKANLISEVRNYTLTEVIEKTSPEVLGQVEFDGWVIDIVKQGMLSVTEDGTGSTLFSDYAVKIGGKTGTAEAPGGDHSIFIAFAPFENPEIAVSVVVEHGKKSYTSGSVLKAILDEYFIESDDNGGRNNIGVLLK